MSAAPEEPSHAAPSGEVITFYSYKGGTGRSMLLANVAWMLASVGRKVLLIDWDLEAPGLHRYFKPFLGADAELQEQEGVIDWLQDYWDAMLEQQAGADIESVVRTYADPRRYVRRLQTERFLVGGIDLLGPGRQDENYADAVADFDFTLLYERLRGADFIDAAKRILTGPGGYDVVLVDSRTGVSDTSGFCTVGLADTLVVCFTYNNQSVIGASAIAQDISRQAQALRARAVAAADGSTGVRPFRLFAVPSRYEVVSPERLERRQQQAWSAFGPLLTDIPEEQQSSYWLAVQIRNEPNFAYEEVLAACMDRGDDPQSLLGSATMLTRFLTDQAFVASPPLDDEQRRMLREMFAAPVSAADPAPRREAWDRFCHLVSDSGARDSVLKSCWPLLSQFYAPASALESGDVANVQRTDAFVVRVPLLEHELTNEERGMAENLIVLGLVQRRISDDRLRALSVADESVLQRWDALHRRLLDVQLFLAYRERVRQARRGWEAKGRPMQALLALPNELAGEPVATENQPCMGRLNLAFVEALRAAQMMQSRADAAERRAEMLVQEVSSVRDTYALRTDSISAHTRELAAQSQAIKEGQQRRLILTLAVSFGVLAVFFMIGWLQYQRSAIVREELRSDLQRANEMANAAESARAVAESRLGESERLRTAERAKVLYAEANQLVTGSRATRFDEAIVAFGKVIEADPTYAEAYRGRAQARARATEKDEDAELADWAAYYDLRPSLNGRSLLIERALRASSVNATLVSTQLEKLASDAQSPGSRDASPRTVAARLEAAFEKAPAVLQGAGRRAIEGLRAVQDAPSLPPLVKLPRPLTKL